MEGKIFQKVANREILEQVPSCGRGGEANQLSVSQVKGEVGGWPGKKGEGIGSCRLGGWKKGNE